MKDKPIFMMNRKIYTAASLLMAALSTSAQVAGTDTAVMAPRVVGVPPSDAYIGLSLLETGEIRHYNYGEQADPGSFYLSSVDKGFTWKHVNTPADIPFADTRSPLSGEYLRLIVAPRMGTYALRTDGGINGNRTLTKISDSMAIMLKPPVFIRGGKRAMVAGHYGLQPGLPKVCFTFVSDDDGRTWYGFRELYLDPRRDAADFGTASGIDKSVHQNRQHRAALCDVPLSPETLKIRDNKPHLIRIDWNLDTKHPAAEVYVDNRRRLTVPLRNASQHGLSYVHFLSDTRADDIGYEIEWVKAEAGR